MTYVCKPAPGGGFVMMNRAMKWTPVLSFAHQFDEAYAAHLAQAHAHVRAYTAEFLSLSRTTARPSAMRTTNPTTEVQK